jgi:hypothetical protein
MPDTASTNYVMMWNKNPGTLVQGTNLKTFSGGPSIPAQIVNSLSNLTEESKFWMVNADQAETVNTVQKTQLSGQVSDNSLFVCGFFVLKGNVSSAIQLHQQIDFSFMSKYVGSLSQQGMDDLIAHSTFTFMPVQNMDASVVLVWAKKSEKGVDFPVDMVIDIINAYNVWGRALYRQGILLDAGRMFVRINRIHFDSGIKDNGPKNDGKLIVLGSYNNKKSNIEDAFAAAGLRMDDTVIEIAGCNGWCAAMKDVPDELLNPRNDIFV